MKYIDAEKLKKLIDEKWKELANKDFFEEGGKRYSEETIAEFKNGIEILKKAYIYAQRIDWLLSGDDGEESFHERLKEELQQLKTENMSKRSEEAAKEIHYLALIEANRIAREQWDKGYEQAEKDTLNRAILWLKENAEKYIINMTESYPDALFEARIGGKCWDDLAKAMEEE